MVERVKRSRPNWLDLPGRRAGYTAAVVSGCALWFLGRWDVVAPLSPLELVLLLGAGNLCTTVVGIWWRRDRASTARLLAHVAAETGLVTIVIYATGWGPVLAIGYVFVVHSMVEEAGARAWRAVLGCTLGGIALGHLAIAADVAPSLIDPSRMHGLGILAALGLAFVVRVFGLATEEKEQARETVERNEHRLSALVQNASDVIVVIDRDRSFVYVSPAIERLLGAPAESYLGPNHLDIHPEDLDLTRDVFLQALERPGEQFHTEARVQHRDGSWLWMEASLVNLLDDPAVAGVVVNLHDVTDRRYQALHDVLTGLPNRVSLGERVRQSLDAGRARDAHWALVLFDLDRFREVNDTFGHDNGDKLLHQVGARISQLLRDGDVVARLGGDEFAVFGEVDDTTGALVVAARVRDAMRRPFLIEDVELSVNASVGVVCAPEHGDQLDELLARADVAMYVAKTGRNGYELYDSERDRSSVGRIAMAGELRRAIEGRELTLHYQPKVELATGRVIGAEALVRWEHPRHGLVTPDAFMPVAEQTGLIEPLCNYVLEDALTECRRWREAGFDLRVAVNLSTRNLVDLSLADDVRRLLAEVGVAADSLDLEITESSLLADPVRAADVVQQLNALGARIGIDDFGTGYSSLAHLRRLLVSEIKIDKSFVMTMAVNADDAIIVRSTIELAHGLGLRVVAEGIESKVVLDQLRALGCDVGQGYFLCRPIPGDQLMDWLRSQQQVTERGVPVIAAR